MTEILHLMSPEITLLAGAIVILMLGVFTKDSFANSAIAVAIVIIAVSAALTVNQSETTQSLFGGAFVHDGFARFMKLLTLMGSAFALLLSFDYLRREGILKFEYPVLILISTAGMLMMISAGDLISLYLALELQSLALYVVAAFHRDNLRSTEAGLKYLVLGVLSSGLLLYGCSLVYGYTGTTVFAQISNIVAQSGASVGFVFGLVFILAGLAFKVAAVPFHMWTPDVYEGAPTPVTAFFAAAPKAAAMALTVRVTLDGFGSVTNEWQQIVIAVSIASMALGAFAAIGQNNIKRLMAYSAIGHVGYAFIGLAAATPEGVASLLSYMAIYLAMTLGTFASILCMRQGGAYNEDVRFLAGLSRQSPLFAFLFAMLLFSLAGIPPLAGFFAKFYVFDAAIRAGFYWLAVIGVVASVISAYYYLRIVKIMYFDEPSASFDAMPLSLRFTIAISSLAIMLYVISPSALTSAASTAARSLF
jgi:NADH-quinone oxidoreductase subunit N